jgi:chromosome segregation ATPase
LKSGKKEQDEVATLQREKANLKDSLKAEMLANEEQRNYIEILKEALESKIDKLGISDLLIKITEEGKTPTEAFTKLVKANKEDITEMEGLIIDLKTETERQRKELDDLGNEHSKVVQERDMAVSKLEEITKDVCSVIMVVYEVAAG